MKLLRRIAILIAILSSILFLSSCTTYRYDVTYEKCNGKEGFGTYIGKTPPYIDTYREAVPILIMSSYSDKIVNVCDFSYVRNPIE